MTVLLLFLFGLRIVTNQVFLIFSYFVVLPRSGGQDSSLEKDTMAVSISAPDRFYGQSALRQVSKFYCNKFLHWGIGPLLTIQSTNAYLKLNLPQRYVHPR